jgi:hypothetical protein
MSSAGVPGIILILVIIGATAAVIGLLIWLLIRTFSKKIDARQREKQRKIAVSPSLNSTKKTPCPCVQDVFL